MRGKKKIPWDFWKKCQWDFLKPLRTAERAQGCFFFSGFLIFWKPLKTTGRAQGNVLFSGKWTLDFLEASR